MNVLLQEGAAWLGDATLRTMLPSSSFGIFSKNRMSLSRSFSELFVTQLSLDELLDEEKNTQDRLKRDLARFTQRKHFIFQSLRHHSRSQQPTPTAKRWMDKEIEVRSQNLRIGKDRKA